MLSKEVAFALCRHLLTAVGGVGVAKGVVDASSADAVVGGVMTIMGVVWSVWDKKKTA